MKPRFILGVDQCGHTYKLDPKCPRKDLKEQIGRGKIHKMYVDREGGKYKHVGYVIGEAWVTLYNAMPWEKEIPKTSEYAD